MPWAALQGCSLHICLGISDPGAVLHPCPPPAQLWESLSIHSPGGLNSPNPARFTQICSWLSEVSGPCGGDRGLQEGQQGILSPRGSDPAPSDKTLGPLAWAEQLGLPIGSQGMVQAGAQGIHGLEHKAWDLFQAVPEGST